MRTAHLLPIVCFLALLPVINSCKKKTATPEKPKGVVICKVNGVSWQSGDAATTVKIGSYTYYKTSATLRNDSLWLTGIRNQTDTSSIYMFSVPLKAGAVGSVTGTTSAYKGLIYLPLYDINSLVAVLGKYNVTYELNITAKDAAAKTISGNFIINMASGKGNITVTEGEFIELKYK
jgi:hypothetical protein